jgi:hypothetical protein
MQGNNKLHSCNSRQKLRRILGQFKVRIAEWTKRDVTLKLHQLEWTVTLKFSKMRNYTNPLLNV